MEQSLPREALAPIEAMLPELAAAVAGCRRDAENRTAAAAEQLAAVENTLAAKTAALAADIEPLRAGMDRVLAGQEALSGLATETETLEAGGWARRSRTSSTGSAPSSSNGSRRRACGGAMPSPG